MAFLFKQRRRKGGKVVLSECWHIRFRDPKTRRLVTFTGYADRQATEQLAARLVREASRHAEDMGPPASVAKGGESAMPALLDRFERDLRSAGRTEKHIQMRLAHCRQTAAALRWSVARDLDAGRLQQWLAERRAPGEASISGRTAAHWLTSLKAFGYWLVRVKALGANPLADASGPTVTDTPHARRTLSPKELAVFFQSVAGDFRGLSGPDRAILYRVAAGTGLRRNELASLTSESFHLTDTPTVTLAAGFAKNRKAAVLPLSPTLAKLLRAWMKGRVGLLWPGTWIDRSAKMLRGDLKRAGIEYKTAAGVFDFHSWRSQYISDLARAGVPLQVAQKLARHSDPRLTASTYTRLSIQDLAEAVKRLK
jgi:integrase